VDPVTATAVADVAMASSFNTSALVLSLMRWFHYIAGILWIGHLYFFNFVNVNLQGDANYPPEMKKVVNPLMMTRALFMFRWGAMFTFITGLYMMDMLYDHGRVLALAGSNLKAAYMAMGIVFGTIMWFNVWFVIWPRQKKIIGAAQGGPAADPALPKQAALASKINTYLSVPMLLGMMGGAHGEYQLPGGNLGLLLGVLGGLALVWHFYKLAPRVSTKIFKG